MVTLKQLLLRTHQNLLILQEREAKQAGDADLKLLNQISDHQAAIQLIEESTAVELTAAQLARLKEQLRPLLIAGNVEQLNLDQLQPDTPRLPFEPQTVPIPAGPFHMGSETGPPEESPRHPVNLPAYAIGKTPVTVAQYARFVQQAGLPAVPKKAGWQAMQPPADKLGHPVVGVSWHDAVAYCRWLSGQTGRVYRLPTEAEWEKAAAWAGREARLYPWGHQFSADCCNSAASGLADTTPVGRYSPQGDSFFGCADMAGNVQEWTNTLWGRDLQHSDYPYPYQPRDGREDAAPQRLLRAYYIYRGGSFRDDAERLRCAARGHSDPDSRLRWRGFRVALEIV